MAFWAIDPWGDQRADLRMARMTWAVLQVASKAPVDEDGLRLYPDEANNLPEDVSDDERKWMMKLGKVEE